MPTSFRIFKTKHAAGWFDGEGACLYGGRWNSRGMRLLYTSATLSLATLEVLVNINSVKLLSLYSFAAAEFDENHVLDIENPASLPKNWSDSPAPIAIQNIGDEWARARASLVLKVPSSVTPTENNFLINVEHPDFTELKLGPVIPFNFDGRLLTR